MNNITCNMYHVSDGMIIGGLNLSEEDNVEIHIFADTLDDAESIYQKYKAGNVQTLIVEVALKGSTKRGALVQFISNYFSKEMFRKV